WLAPSPPRTDPWPARGFAEPAVPDVRVLDDEPAHPRAWIQRPDQDGRSTLPRCHRQEARPSEPVVGAVEVQRLVVEEVACDPQRLLEPTHTLLVGESEGEVLALR